MPVNSSHNPWHTCTRAWPVDRLRLDVEIVRPRPLTALEWLVLRVVDGFPGATPPLAEVADELGLDRREFLRDTLREVVRLRALAAREPDVPVLDLGDVAFTDLGRQLYRRGQIEADPATHAIIVDIDALTDENLPPADRSSIHNEPALAADDPRTAIGLDRLREVMRSFHRDLLAGDAVVRAHRVRDAERVYVPVNLAFEVDAGGTLIATCPARGSVALDVVREIDAKDLGLDTDTLLPAGSSHASGGHDFTVWKARTTRTVPRSAVAAEAVAVIHRACRELVVHRHWLLVDGIRDALDAAMKRGVHLVIAAADAPVLAATDRGEALVLRICAPSVRPLPCTLIADDVAGLLLDDVDLRWRDELVRCHLVGAVEGEHAATLRRLLVDAVLAHLPDVPPSHDTPASPLHDWTVRAHFARLYLAPIEAHAAALTAALDRRSSGLDGVLARHRLSRIGRTLAPNLPTNVWDWRSRWDDVLLDLLLREPLPAADLQRLLDAAPPGVVADDFVTPAVEARATGVGGLERRTLRAIRTIAAHRWGPQAAAGCRAWIEARDRNLVAIDLAASALRDLVDDVTDLLPAREATAWALDALARLPGPAHGFTTWAASATLLRGLAGAAWHDRAAAVWRTWVASSPPDLDAALPLAFELLPMDTVVAPLLPRDSSPAQVLAARRRIAAVRPSAAAAPLWVLALRAALPQLGSSYRVTTHGPLVRTLVRDTKNWPEGQAAITAWATVLADAMGYAHDLPALVFWFGELAGLAPALGGGLLPRARAAIQPHRPALREARTRESPVWTRVVEAWRILGLGSADLEALAAPAKTPPPAAHNRKKGRGSR